MRQPIIKNGLIIQYLDAEIQVGFETFINTPERKFSPEVDYGCHWVEILSPTNFPRWRVSWIENTGELYAVEISYVLPHLRRYAVFGTYTRDEVESLMDGWYEAPFRLGPLCNLLYKNLTQPSNMES